MRRLKVLCLATAIAVCAASPAIAETATTELTKKIESFDFLVDYASSMSRKYPASNQSKIETAKDVMQRVNQKIPRLDYQQAGIHTFAPISTVQEYVPYERDVFQESVDKISSSRDSSSRSFGEALDKYDPAYSDLLRKGAVIAVTDGEYGGGRDSYNEAKIFYLTQPGMCLHFISMADTDKGQALIDKMSSLNPCSVSVKAEDLLNDEKAVDTFVRKVFYDGKASDGIEFEKDITLSVPFAFDSDNLDERTTKIVNAALNELVENPKYNLRLEGHTCSLGKDAYNKSLSLKRANRVRNLLVNNGIDESRIQTFGHGEERPMYENKTEEGRKLNRRVDFTFYENE